MAAAQRPAGPPGGALSALPDDVLERCLAGVPQEERLRSTCLVSKRFHRLCTGPQLLQQLRVRCTSLAAAEALAAFLCKHARHVRVLHATFKRGAEAPADLAAAIAIAVTAAGAAGQLRELELEAERNWSLPLEDGAAALPTAWLPAVPTLQRLAINTSTGRLSRLAPGAHCLTALKFLNLSGGFELSADTALPTSITCLQLECNAQEAMPPQVFALPHLRRLELVSCGFSAASMNELSRLRSLSRLEMFEASLPACLPAMSALRRLDVKFWSPQDNVQLDAALGQLQQLTSLVLDDGDHVPASVGGLAQLARFYCWVEPAAHAQLPVGPWLRSIRWLCAPPAMLFNSVQQLGGAIGLEVVGLSAPFRDDESGTPAWRAFWNWVAAHPPLRYLHIDFGAADMDDDTCVWKLMDEVARTVAARPTLLLSRRNEKTNSFREMLDADAFAPVPL